VVEFESDRRESKKFRKNHRLAPAPSSFDSKGRGLENGDAQAFGRAQPSKEQSVNPSSRIRGGSVIRKSFKIKGSTSKVFTTERVLGEPRKVTGPGARRQ
jgi:hypothetical protein